VLTEDTVLVTGASGLLGSNFVLTSKGRCKNVIALCYPRLLDFPDLKTVLTDLADTEKVKALIQEFQPDWIVHCAALTNVDWCETHRQETWNVNVEMTRTLASAAREVNAGFVYISSDSVFNGQVGHYSEESEPSPLNVYAESKLAGELATKESVDNSLIVRTNIYGWNAEQKMSLAEWMLDKLETNQPVPGFYDIIFTPILVNDLSEIILDMLELGLKGIYHVAGSQPCSKYEFALQLAGVFDFDKELIKPIASVDSNALKTIRPRNTSLQTNKVSDVLCRKMPDVKSGLDQFKTLRDSGYFRRLKAMRGG